MTDPAEHLQNSIRQLAASAAQPEALRRRCLLDSLAQNSRPERKSAGPGRGRTTTVRVRPAAVAGVRPYNFGVNAQHPVPVGAAAEGMR